MNQVFGSTELAANRQYYDQPHRLLVIPAWIETAFHRKNLDLADLVSFEHACQAATPYDLASVVALQSMDLSIMGLIYGDLASLDACWINMPNTSIPNYQEQVSTIFTIAESDEVNSDTYVRLFEESSTVHDLGKSFKIVELKSNYLGAVVYPGYFNGDPARILAFQDALIQEQYRRHPLSVIAQQPVFRRYLDSLSKKRLAG